MAQTGRFYDSYNEYGSNQFQATDRFRIHASVFLPHGEVDPETGLLREGTEVRTATTAAPAPAPTTEPAASAAPVR